MAFVVHAFAHIPRLDPWSNEEKAEFQYLSDWTDTECKTFGLPPVKEMNSQQTSPIEQSVKHTLKNLKREDLT